MRAISSASFRSARAWWSVRATAPDSNLGGSGPRHHHAHCSIGSDSISIRSSLIHSGIVSASSMQPAKGKNQSMQQNATHRSCLDLEGDIPWGINYGITLSMSM